MKIYAKLHSLSHSSHSIQHLPGLRDTPKPCQDSLIKPTSPVAKRGNWTTLDFSQAGKNISQDGSILKKVTVKLESNSGESMASTVLRGNRESDQGNIIQELWA